MKRRRERGLKSEGVMGGKVRVGGQEDGRVSISMLLDHVSKEVQYRSRCDQAIHDMIW